MSAKFIRNDATRWEKYLIYIAGIAGSLALFGGIGLLWFGLAIGAVNPLQTTNGLFAAILLFLAAGYLASGITIARRQSSVAWGVLMLIFAFISLGSLLTMRLQGLVYGLGGLYVGYRAATEASYEWTLPIDSVTPGKLVVGALLVVILVSTGVLVTALSPAIPTVLGPAGDTTPNTGTATSSGKPSTPVSPTPTYEPPTPDGEFGFTTRFEADRAIRFWQVQMNTTNTESESDGDVTVTDGRLQLRAFRCHRVIAERTVGRANGTFTVTINWTTRAEEWYERPDWSLVTADGEELNYTVTDGHDIKRPNKSSTRRGRLVATASANTTVKLRFSIYPSQYCHRSNHKNTYLLIDGIRVSN